MTTTLPPALIAAYQATHYQVFIAGETITLRIGAISSRLFELHKQHDVTCSGFLTAWNPYSVNVSLGGNCDAQTSLLEKLGQLKLALLPGLGIDPAGSVPGEESVLALGLTSEEAISFGNQYQQNAVVWIGNDAVPELILLK